MNEEQLEKFCVSLAEAENEGEVISVLKKARYWDDDHAWQYYGGDENNFATIGNQQNNPDTALVEKITNSVDAVLMRECLKRKIKPDGSSAPKNIPNALKKFFDIFDGKLSNLNTNERATLSKNILLVVTGEKSNPSYSIIDLGEGQTPNEEKWCQLYFYKNKIMAVIKKKCWPEWFEKFVSGERTFELRLADFELKTGDILIMEEYNPETKKCTGRKAEFKCKKVEHSAQDPLQFYKVEDVRKHGFWIIELEK